ncbi:MAG: hypothetical protein HY365_01780 [Candidatus Aenigmarchaeota archaeon]|nr:hypothetical protein [Candidatus Aenigmarchaeota archaeon]
MKVFVVLVYRLVRKWFANPPLSLVMGGFRFAGFKYAHGIKYCEGVAEKMSNEEFGTGFFIANGAVVIFKTECVTGNGLPRF